MIMRITRSARDRRAAQARRARIDREALDQIAALLRGESPDLTYDELFGVIIGITGLSGRITDASGPDHDAADDEQQPLTLEWLKEFSRPRGRATRESDGEQLPPFCPYPNPDDLRFPHDECYGTDGQPLPHGRCDTCGAPCSANGCTADPAHVVALDGS